MLVRNETELAPSIVAARAMSSSVPPSARSFLPMLVIHVSNSGATKSTPIASPVHHTHQTDGKALHGTIRASARSATPLVADTVIATADPNTASRRTSRTRSSAFSKSNRRRRKAPNTGASVLPVAIAAAVQIGSELRALLTNAPIQMPGHTRYPQSKSAASAMPVGGQTAVTCFVANASVNPSFAATTYASATNNGIRIRPPTVLKGAGVDGSTRAGFTGPRSPVPIRPTAMAARASRRSQPHEPRNRNRQGNP